MTGNEWLCLWYLRLNGYFTLPNFYAHRRSGPLTEVDVLGVRFPYSKENNFEDDEKALNYPSNKVDIVLGEAKTKHIEELNGPWGSPDGKALQYVLQRVGIVPPDAVKNLAGEIFAKKRAVIDGIMIRVVCFAESIGDELLKADVTFVSWDQVLAFIYGRFRENHRLKADHEKWDEFGQFLWRHMDNPRPPDPNSLCAKWDALSYRYRDEILSQ